MNIQELKNKGYRVSLTTRRYMVGESKSERITELRNRISRQSFLFGGGGGIDPRGGETDVLVITPKGQVLRGSSVCSRKDNFNRKLGNEIALYRALSQEDPNYQATPYELPVLKLSEEAEKMMH